MYYLKADISHPLTLVSCGYFVSDGPWIHTKRNLDSFEVIIGVKGTIFMQQDEERYTVTPENALLLLPGHTHQGYEVSHENVSFYWMHFQCKSWELIDKAQASDVIRTLSVNPNFNGFTQNILLPVFMKLSCHEKLTIHFVQLMHSANFKNYTAYVSDYMLTLILMELTQQFLDAAMINIPKFEDTRIHTMLEWIHIHLNSNLTLTQLAEKFGYNKDYLSRYFKKQTGMTILKYINSMRILKAKELLCESAFSIKEIAYQLGFKDDKYFMKQFKKSENITPSKYREIFYKVHLNNK